MFIDFDTFNIQLSLVLKKLFAIMFFNCVMLQMAQIILFSVPVALSSPYISAET